MSFDECTYLCDPTPITVENIPSRRKCSYPPFQSVTLPPSLGNRSSAFLDLPVLEHQPNRIPQSTVFWVGLLLLSIMFLRFFTLLCVPAIAFHCPGVFLTLAFFFLFFFLIYFFFLFIFFKFYFILFIFILFYFIFKLYITVLVLPNIKMNPPQVYMCHTSIFFFHWLRRNFGVWCVFVFYSCRNKCPQT